MAGGEGALGGVEMDAGGGFAGRFEGDLLERIEVAGAGLEAAFFADRFVDPGDAVEADFVGEKAGGIGAVEGDEETVLFEVFSDDDEVFVVGVGGDADAAALADGVEVEAFVVADLASVGGPDFAGFVLDVVAEEIGHADVADEADSLAVFFLRVGEIAGDGDFADFGFAEVADREFGAGELFLAEHGEEVALVFLIVNAFKEIEGAVVAADFAGVMSGGDGGETFGEGVVEEDAELHFAVAHHIGVRGDAAFIAVEEVFDDALFVLVDEVDDAELDAEGVGGGAGVFDVLLPRAIAEDVFLVDPVFHVGADDLRALFLEEKSGDRAVDPARHCYQNFAHFAKRE